MRLGFILLVQLVMCFFNGLSQTSEMRNENSYALRLKPGDDLKQKLTEFIISQNIEAGYIVTCVGSLQELSLRFANQEQSTIIKNKFEIVSLVGTLSVYGCHLHLSAADSTGAVIGGHLTDGNIIYTTAEIIIGKSPELIFKRETDPKTSFKELEIIKK